MMQDVSLRCQELSVAGRCKVTSAGYDGHSVTKTRPVFFPALGAYFKSLRDAKGWNQSQAADMAVRRKITLTYQQIRGLEEGKTYDPDPQAMRAVAELYDVSFEEVLAAVITHRYGVSVPATAFGRRGRTTQPSRPSAQARAAARISALEERVATYKATMRQMRAPIAKLAALLDAIHPPTTTPEEARVDRLVREETRVIETQARNRQSKKKPAG